VVDAGSELDQDDIKLYLDGLPKEFSYDQETDLLIAPTGRLSRGRHTVTVEATDAAGNKAVETWSFRVVKKKRR
jgi:hypothetical protein